MAHETENPSTKLFRDYIRIPSVHPDPDYYQVIDLLTREALKIGLNYKLMVISHQVIYQNH